MPLFLGFLKKLKKEDKLKSDDIDNELIKYIKLKMTKLRYMMIEEFKDELKNLRELKELKSVREQEINEMKNTTKRKLNLLDDEISNTLEN